MMNERIITIGTRGSNLALTQTEEVKKLLEERHPQIKIEVKVIKTKGDKILDVALSKIGDKGLFTKELEVALINREIDFAVHSLKDIPTKLPDGLVIGAMTKRHIPNDCLVVNKKHKECKLDTLPQGSVIGSSSLRRVSQLQRLFPHLIFKDIRGNLNTRLQKLDDDNSGFDALILAVAGLSRLGFGERIQEILPTELCYHAVGQGALGIECRADDKELLSLLITIHDTQTQLCCEAERSFLRETEGGCQVPVGVLTTVNGELLAIKGIILSIDGSKATTGEVSGSINDAVGLGKELADRMKKNGADVILKEVFESIARGKKVD